MVIKKETVSVYQHGEYKIELKSTTGNFEIYVNGELLSTTKGGIKIQLSPDIMLSAQLPSGEELLAIKREKVFKGNEYLLFVGKQLTAQE